MSVGNHRLILLRHGETEWSRDHKHTSTTDLDLTEIGRQQAGRAAATIAALHLADPLVVSSPRRRALATAELAGLSVDEVSALIVEWAGVLTLVVVMLWTAARERHRIESYLAGEVLRGTLTERQYNVVKSYRLRCAERMRAILAGDLQRWVTLGRYYRLATELSFLRHRCAQDPEGEQDAGRIALLRDAVCSLGETAWRRGCLSGRQCPHD